MVAFSFLAVSALAAGASVGAKFTAPVHDQRAAPAAGFAPLRVATDAHVLDMRVRLAQRDPDGLRAALLAVSTPGNPRYGQHLTKDEVAAFTRPAPESTRAVLAFFAARGLNATAASSSGDWLRVRVPAPTANALFGADYRVFAHQASGRQLVRTLQYSLPDGLREHVRMVHPSTSFFNARSLPIKTSSSVGVRRRANPPADLGALLGALNSTLAPALDADSSRALARVLAAVRTKSSPSSATKSYFALSNFAVDRHHAHDFDLGDIDLSGLPDWLQKILQGIFQHFPGSGNGGGGAPEPAPLPTDAPLPLPTDVPLPTDAPLPIPTDVPLPPGGGGGGGEGPEPTEDPSPAPTGFPGGEDPNPFPPGGEDPTPVPPDVPTELPRPTGGPTDVPPEPLPTDPLPEPVPTSDPAPEPIPTSDPGPGTPDADCAEFISPKCLQQLYGIPTAPATQQSNKLLVTGYIGQFAQSKDLRAFLEQFRPDIDPKTTFDVQTLDGGVNPQGNSQAGIEANLDVQYTVGVATGVPTTFVSVGEDGPQDSFLDTITALIDADAPPQVMTTSYGEGESDAGPDLADALCNAYMQLGARGVSIVFASGDSGVGDAQGTCRKTFAPTFPSGCPYITSVGSTQGFAPETAAAFSSGGFSDLFAMPDYQAAAVSKYLAQLGDTYAGRFNPKGRAFPDVSTQGVDFAVVNAGRVTGVQGTSASAPLFASVVALLNDERAAAGKPPLGFLNPWLYSDAAGAFSDVTRGSNPGCGTDGFEALPGWDPVTGLGTPNYAALRKAAGLA
ncbi:subtilisin-like protein [Auricularia subglabra TFB-10046 SS5]|nr:subtilisin-like protein [Auricularia subglabra TFB-10046 SS5]